jgi:hypothetical protein
MIPKEVIIMAQKRMFSLIVTDTDRFLELPGKTQALYFHLGMAGDDDGFVASPKKLARAARCTEKDLKLLEDAGYILRFPSGVVCMTHWYVNNTLKNDRYTPTVYQAELSMLEKDETGMYLWKEPQGKAADTPAEAAMESALQPNMPEPALEPVPEPDRNQTGTTVEPQQNITEHNITKHNIHTKGRAKPSCVSVSPPTVEEIRAYCLERGNQVDPEAFLDYYSARDWTMNKTRIKDWKACVRTWERRVQGTLLTARDAYVPLHDTCSGWMEA